VRASLRRGMVVLPSTHTRYLYHGFVKRDRRTGSCPERRSRSSTAVGAHGSSWMLRQAGCRHLRRSPLDTTEPKPARTPQRGRFASKIRCFVVQRRYLPGPARSRPERLRADLATRASSMLVPTIVAHGYAAAAARLLVAARVRVLIFNRTALLVDVWPLNRRRYRPTSGRRPVSRRMGREASQHGPRRCRRAQQGSRAAGQQ
jgi:hypothetical protein